MSEARNFEAKATLAQLNTFLKYCVVIDLKISANCINFIFLVLMAISIDRLDLGI
jgi:hypothetical protein